MLFRVDIRGDSDREMCWMYTVRGCLKMFGPVWRDGGPGRVAQLLTGLTVTATKKQTHAPKFSHLRLGGKLCPLTIIGINSRLLIYEEYEA